jgi:hypothetical protein
MSTKRQPKPSVRGRITYINVCLRMMSQFEHLNGMWVEFYRADVHSMNQYHHITNASLLRIARVGRAIAKAAQQ